MAALRTTDDFLFLSEIVGEPIKGKDGARIGRVTDLIVSVDEFYPRVTGVLVRCGRRNVQRIPWRQVVLRYPPLGMKIEDDPDLEPPAFREYELPIGARMLDQQVVDTEGCKVVRVNDIHFVKADRNLHLVHADVGTRGLLRRLGWLRIVDGLMEWLFGDTLSDQFVSWKDVHLLSTGPQTGIQLKFSSKKLSEIHPSDLAEILEDLTIHEQSTILQSLGTETAAQALSDIEQNMQVSLMEHLEPTMAADLLEEMPANEAADLLGALRDEVAEELLDQMEDEAAEEIRELLTYEEDTAGGAMTTDFVTVSGSESVGEVIELLRSREDLPEVFTAAYAVDRLDRLAGVVSVSRLLLSTGSVLIADIMEDSPCDVGVDARLQEVRDLFGKYDLTELPVLDGEGRLKGIISLREAVKGAVEELQ